MNLLIFAVATTITLSIAVASYIYFKRLFDLECDNRLQRFHMSCKVHDLDEVRDFYVNVFGFIEGDYSERDKWMDFDACGNQVSIHLEKNIRVAHDKKQIAFGCVDKDEVPLPHWGIILPQHKWETLRKRVEQMKVGFVIEPDVRFEGTAREQKMFMLLDPSGNVFEFKTFRDNTEIFKQNLDDEAA